MPTASKRSESHASRQVRGTGGEWHQLAGPEDPILTTNLGAPLADNQNSLRAHVRGPSLLEDFIQQEKLSNFNRERIPERVVHARGTGAHGYFELTESLADVTTAKVLSAVGRRVPVFARFSTVAGSAGSMDTVRDVRGFAVKFYTDEGNWDLVGNNIPVFFIQDSMKFPDLVHSVKREPDRGFPSAASAHDTFWDFISQMPESLHMILWVMSDRAIPRYLRTMEGFGVHTYRLIDSNGRATFVKYHWRPAAGLASLVWEEAVQLAGADSDFHRRDLYEAINRGDYPEWQLGVQLFSEQEAEKLPFDPLDATKLIPEEIVPVRIIGRMILNRNPDSVFEETEQAAFSPSNIVPGMDFSNDPLLQGRIFAYFDTQLHRLGGPNFQRLPINRPQCPMANFQRDGFMQYQLQTGRVAYEPNTLAPTTARATELGLRPAIYAHAQTQKTRDRSEKFSDHYSQASMFFQSQTSVDQGHIVAALVFELSKVETVAIREMIVSHLRSIDENLARRVAHGLAMDPLPVAAKSVAPAVAYPESPALQTVGKALHTLKGRCIGVLIDNGSDAALLDTLRKLVEKAGGRCMIVAPKVQTITLNNDQTVPADAQLAGAPAGLFDAIAVILSEHAANALSKENAAPAFLRDAYVQLKAIGVDLGGSALMASANVDPDDGVVELTAPKRYLEAATKRHWEREPNVKAPI